MELAAKLPALWDEYDRLDEEHGRRFQTLPKAARVTKSVIEESRRGMPAIARKMDKVWGLKRAVESMIAQTRATSVEGALVQIALAAGHADIIESSEGDFHDIAADIISLLYSATAVIEATTGKKRPTAFENQYMPDKLNPFALADFGMPGAEEMAEEGGAS
jgi:hypothetical protein